MKQLNEYQKLWYNALISGKYKRAKQKLKTTGDNPGFCCLGVAADLYPGVKWTIGSWGDSGGRSLPRVPDLSAPYTGDVITLSFGDKGVYLTPFLLEDLGITDFDQKALATVNDESEADDFSEVARKLRSIWVKNGYDVQELNVYDNSH